MNAGYDKAEGEYKTEWDKIKQECNNLNREAYDDYQRKVQEAASRFNWGPESANDKQSESRKQEK